MNIMISKINLSLRYFYTRPQDGDVSPAAPKSAADNSNTVWPPGGANAPSHPVISQVD